MPRWPAGLHLQSGALPSLGGHSRRIPVTSPRAYWRQTVAELHAGANGVFNPIPQPGPVFRWVATAAPQGAGEKWDVDIVQVQFPVQYGQAPLVVQQILAQIAGTNTAQPPPNVAQAWLQIGGVNTYLLAQSTQGGNDAMTVSCPRLSAGEAIAVLFFGPLAQGIPWMALRGTKHVLVDG